MKTKALNREDAKVAKLTKVAGLGAEIEQVAHDVIAAAVEVHKLLGPGYLESVYEEAMAVELTIRGIPFERQVPVNIIYKGNPVGNNRLDFRIEDLLVVELKAVEQLAPIHTAQVISYLRATRLSLGLLFNFNVPTLKAGMRRIVLSQE